MQSINIYKNIKTKIFINIFKNLIYTIYNLNIYNVYICILYTYTTIMYIVNKYYINI